MKRQHANSTTAHRRNRDETSRRSDGQSERDCVNRARSRSERSRERHSATPTARRGNSDHASKNGEADALVQKDESLKLILPFAKDWIRKVEKISEARYASGVCLMMSFCQQLKMTTPVLETMEATSFNETSYRAHTLATGLMACQRSAKRSS